MTQRKDEMPTIEVFRGVKIHDFQTPDRVEVIVKPAVDKIHAMSGPTELAAFLKDPQNPPEARLLAFAKVQALWEIAAEKREGRPSLDMDHLRACVAGLDSLLWADPFEYTTLLEPRAPGEHRPERTQDAAAALERAQDKFRATERLQAALK